VIGKVRNLINKKVHIGVWAIKVFKSQSLISKPPHQSKLSIPTLKASDIKDVHAEFIADPFITMHNSFYYMFFEVFDKSIEKGIIGVAISKNGEDWEYEKIVLRENYHLSYPYVFEYNNEFYMIPESNEANKVLLYKARNFPFDWVIESELLTGKYVDSSIFQYNNKWWMFAAENGKLHLFFSNELKGNWIEHPQSPLITNNNAITRPAGRVIVENDKIYRYTQDGEPNYGSSVKVFVIKHLSEKEYIEEEVDLILSGTRKEKDWRTDGMHSIDQLKIKENEWLIAVDGHKIVYKNYFVRKLESLLSKVFIRLSFLTQIELIEEKMVIIPLIMERV
jgi:hypothetical protein